MVCSCLANPQEFVSFFHSISVSQRLFPLPEYHHHLIGQTQVMGLSLYIFPLDPDRLFEFISVQSDLRAAVDITIKTGQKIIHYAPRLRFVIADILHPEPDLFHDLSGHRLLQCLSDLVEACRRIWS